MMRFDRITLGRQAKELGFVRDTFEKVCRLADVLSKVSCREEFYLHHFEKGVYRMAHSPKDAVPWSLALPNQDGFPLKKDLRMMGTGLEPALYRNS